MIRVVHPGSRIRMLTFYPSRIPDPGVKKALDPGSGSATLISPQRSLKITCKKMVKTILLTYLDYNKDVVGKINYNILDPVMLVFRLLYVDRVNNRKV
jgi:hypothetical protein